MYLVDIPSSQLLHNYIRDGRVDYSRLAEITWLDKQLTKISEADLDGMSENERLAFWLNAYNLSTLKSVIKYLKDNPEWKGVTSMFQKFIFFVWKKHSIAGKDMSLYHLENKIIRKFGDPRIHFALNCASGSCPYLPDRLFKPETLDQYLDGLTEDFVNNQGGVLLSGESLIISEIFKMYKSDFGQTDSHVIEFIKKYWRGDPIPQSVTLEYQDYDWSLNSQ